MHRSLVTLNNMTKAHGDHPVGMVEVAFNSSLTTTATLINAVDQSGGDGRHEFGATVVDAKHLMRRT
jgi:hypothetical protein